MDRPEIIPIPEPRWRYRDLTGMVFTRLTVVGFVGRRAGYTRWLCDCSCGNWVVVNGAALPNQNTRSCGCLQRDQIRRYCLETNFTHRMSKSDEYRIWSAMKKRCHTPGMKAFAMYGGRGISVCPRWRESFENFYADMGPRPSKAHSIDRYPNKNGNYEPGNCRWATWKEQARNTRRSRIISFQGEDFPLVAWCERLGMPYGALQSRLDRGWTVERAFTTPIKKGNG